RPLSGPGTPPASGRAFLTSSTMTGMVSDARQAAAMAARIFRRREPAISSSQRNRSVGPRDRTHFPSMPDDDLRHFPRRRRVAAALGADDAVDDGHADAGEVAELHAFQNVLAGRVLRLVHQDEVCRASDLDDAA